MYLYASPGHSAVQQKMMQHRNRLYFNWEEKKKERISPNCETQLGRSGVSRDWFPRRPESPTGRAWTRRGARRTSPEPDPEPTKHATSVATHPPAATGATF